jgi:hypothetical protein
MWVAVYQLTLVARHQRGLGTDRVLKAFLRDA